MDVKQLAQDTVDSFNDRTYRQKAMEVAHPDIIIIDKPTGQQLSGVDGFIQYSEGFVNAMPDLKGTAMEHKVEGNKVTTRVHGKGTFSGTLQTPQGAFPGTGNPVDIEYQLEQEFDDAGKLKRFSVDYDMQDFMRQLGLM
jgi:predicted ester cyclase